MVDETNETNPEPAPGQVPAGDFKPVSQESPPQESPPQELVDPRIREIAQEVIAGHWGRGLNRNRRLEAAGYNVQTVNAEILKIMNQ